MSLAASTGHICMRTPELGSILLASTNPDRLRSWYERALAVTPDNQTAHQNLAAALWSKGKTAESHEHARAAAIAHARTTLRIFRWMSRPITISAFSLSKMEMSTPESSNGKQVYKLTRMMATR